MMTEPHDPDTGEILSSRAADGSRLPPPSATLADTIRLLNDGQFDLVRRYADGFILDVGMRPGTGHGVDAQGILLIGLGQLHDVSPVICPHPSVDLGGVGAAYADFPQVPDTEVTRLLAEAAAVARP